MRGRSEPAGASWCCCGLTGASRHSPGGLVSLWWVCQSDTSKRGCHSFLSVLIRLKWIFRRSASGMDSSLLCLNYVITLLGYFKPALFFVCDLLLFPSSVFSSFTFFSFLILFLLILYYSFSTVSIILNFPLYLLVPFNTLFLN